jgi:hypothetical protein
VEKEDKDELKKELEEEFLLIKKGRLFYLVGGAIAAVALAFGIGIKATLDYIGTSEVARTKERISAILKEAETLSWPDGGWHPTRINNGLEWKGTVASWLGDLRWKEWHARFEGQVRSRR